MHTHRTPRSAFATAQPSARLADDGNEDIYIDPEKPVYYTQVREWDSPKGHYTNLIYRVHFEMSKGNSKSTNGGKGYNVGMMAVVTLDSKGKPVLVNAVHTCGCFHTILPTSYLPADDLPEGWDVDHHTVYKEKLPGMLRFPDDYDGSVRPVIFLRDGSHRVAGDRLGFAMPEVSIGLFPDVAGTHFLTRVPGHCGAWLALTGARIGAGDACALGLMTHYVESARMGDLARALEDSGDTDAILARFSAAPLPAGNAANRAVMIGSKTDKRQRSSLSLKEGGNQVEYDEQDPRVHPLWLEEMKKNGVTPKMEQWIK